MAEKKLPGLDDIDLDLSRELMVYTPKNAAHGDMADMPKAPAKGGEGVTVKVLIDHFSKVQDEIKSSLTRKHREEVSALKKRALELLNSLESYKKEYSSVYALARRLDQQAKDLGEENARLKSEMAAMQSQAESMKADFSARLAQKAREERRAISDSMKAQLERELDLKTTISALRKEISSLREASRAEKDRHIERENQIRKKISEIFSPEQH